MEKFKIPVTWEVYGTIEIEADSLEEAIQKFDDIEINGEGHQLPSNNSYIDGSFNREIDKEYIKEYNEQILKEKSNFRRQKTQE